MEGFDDTDQRYYASLYGRFNTPDTQGGHGEDPGSLNKYAYVRGDPVNRNDPKGRCDVVIGGITETSSSNTLGNFANSIDGTWCSSMTFSFVPSCGTASSGHVTVPHRRSVFRAFGELSGMAK